MTINVSCACGSRLRAPASFAGTRAECPTCGRSVQIPDHDPAVGVNGDRAVAAPVAATATIGTGTSDGPDLAGTGQSRAARRPYRDIPDAVEITDFFDPPTAEVDSAEAAGAVPATPVVRRMLEAMLDPRSIQWLLTLGGSLAVIGLIVWLVSLGIFENARLLAAAMGVGTLALFAAGGWTTLKTRYQTAGRALTFLACVIAPLNLWFYHAKEILTIDGGLWVGAAVCCLLYVVTVVALRDRIFMYAIEAGVALTVLLLLADLGWVTDPTWLSLAAMVLGLISLHAPLAFPDDDSREFSRQQFGLPLFHSGQIQVAASLLILLGVQIYGWFFDPIVDLVGDWGLKQPESLIATNRLLAAGIWLAGAYACFYADLIVRRVGRDIYSAAFCLVMAEVTLLASSGLRPEWLITAFALTALAANILPLLLVRRDDRRLDVALLDDSLPRLGLVLNVLPLLLGFALHVRATWGIAAAVGWSYETGIGFVGAMAVAAVCSRLAAWLYRDSSPSRSTTCLALTAAAILIGAAGLLRVLGVTAWTHQAPLLMLVPLLYLAAMRLRRGHQPERPLYWVAHAATAVILAHVLVASLANLRTFVPLRAETANLLLGVVFLEATAFYLAAAWLRRRGVNVYLAAVAASGALWQFLGYFAVPALWHGVVYSGLGLVLLVAARLLGLELQTVWRGRGEERKMLRGPGLPAFQCAMGILLVAFFAAFVQGLGRLVVGGVEWREVATLAVTVGAAVTAAILSPAGTWRRVHLVAAIALTGTTFLTLNEFIALSAWQKLEIFCVVAGLLMLAAAHLARFRDLEAAVRDDTIGLGLWLGAALTTVPLLIATIAHRWSAGPSLGDELALVTVTVLLLAAGLAWKTRATTFFGGGVLFVYLVILFASLVYRPQVAVGAYLAIGGILIFAAGVLLSIYRDRLLSLPEQIASRRGIFQVIDWH